MKMEQRTYEIAKEFYFSSAHQLAGLPDDHPCSRLHGHNYTVTVILRGNLDENGWVEDYGDLTKATRPLIERLDHHNINDVIMPSTAERMAWWFIHELVDTPIGPVLYAVEVKETAKTYARAFKTGP